MRKKIYYNFAEKNWYKYAAYMNLYQLLKSYFEIFLFKINYLKNWKKYTYNY